MKRRAVATALCILVGADVAICGILLFWSRSCCAGRLEHVEAAQLIVLLYGSDPADQEMRLSEVRRLLHLDPAAHAFCAGGARPARNVFHCRDVVARLAREGVDGARLSTDLHSSDTRGNIAAAFAAAGAKEPLFVSDALHLMRARRLAEEIAPGRRYRTSATPEPAGVHLIVRLHWEIAAHVSAALPQGWRQALLGLTRN